MNEPSDHAISLFSEMLQNCQDRENRRTQLIFDFLCKNIDK
jgi:hypothetical protein